MHVFHLSIKRYATKLFFELYTAIAIKFSIAITISRSIIVVATATVIAPYRAKKEPSAI